MEERGEGRGALPKPEAEHSIIQYRQNWAQEVRAGGGGRLLEGALPPAARHQQRTDKWSVLCWGAAGSRRVDAAATPARALKTPPVAWDRPISNDLRYRGGPIAQA